VKSRCRLPRAARITSDKRAEALRAAPRRRGRWFVVRQIGNDEGHARLLVRVAKQLLPNAVSRNRIKRTAREVFRLQRNKVPPVDYFVSLIHPYKDASLLPARQELERLLQS